MKRSRWITAVFIALIGMIASAGMARADATPKVNDAAGFFKPGTIEKVDAELKQLKADTNIEIVVETFEGIPETARARWEAAKDDPKLKAEFFDKWVDARGHDLKLFGVYVLIVKDPPHLAVRAGSKTRAKALPKADQDKVASMLIEEFKAKNYDEGLQKAIDFARDTIKQNLNGQKLQASAGSGHDPFAGSTVSSVPPSSGGGAMPTNTPAQQASTSIFHGSCMWIVIAIVGVFILLSILRRGSNARNYGGGGYNQGPGYGPPGSPGYGGGGGYGPGPARGGGGFMSGIFGGLLGGAAGSYVENRMENHHQGGGNSPTQSGGGPAPDTDNSSSQGDFGSSSSSDTGSSGGDFGGGGGGGSDFGGGGGGGDSGGGSSGGDF